ncbi:hypothetical protein PM082_014431 [Marasmius tenuissimus]|nr:hypothetical protein PM082_014431 [Marasmius tenuissimus]
MVTALLEEKRKQRYEAAIRRFLPYKASACVYNKLTGGTTKGPALGIYHMTIQQLLVNLGLRVDVYLYSALALSHFGPSYLIDWSA